MSEERERLDSVEKVHQMSERHKAEEKALVARITGMKKQASKKTRKQVLKQCQELEQEMLDRHAREVAQVTGTYQEQESLSPEEVLAQSQTEEELRDPGHVVEPAKVPDPIEQLEPEGGRLATEKGGGTTKRNRQKERLARRKAEEEKIRKQAEEEATGQVDYRKIEQESLQDIMASNGLRVWDIRPDGHCLFASILDQLHSRHNIERSVKQLRDDAASYMASHRDDYTPFLLDELNNDVHQFDNYLEELTNTAMWGSEAEISALANVYECPITILAAGASPYTINGDAAGIPLKIAFYKHSYTLGAHYNSVRDM